MSLLSAVLFTIAAGVAIRTLYLMVAMHHRQYLHHRLEALQAEIDEAVRREAELDGEREAELNTEGILPPHQNAA